MLVSLLALTLSAQPELPRPPTEPTPRSAFAVVETSGRIIIAGGGAAGNLFDDTFAYDSKREAWEQLPDLPSARAFTAAAAVNDQAYFFGGLGESPEPFKDAWRLDLSPPDGAQPLWAQLPDPPAARNRHAAAVINDRIYIMGGFEAAQPCSARVESFDANQEVWREERDMNIGRHGHTATVIAGKIYVVGGYTAAGPTDAAEVFDTETDTWTRLAPLPSARGFHCAAEVDGKLYILGGRIRAEEPSYVYSPTLDTWDTLPAVPGVRGRAGCATAEGLILLFGGEDERGREQPANRPLVFAVGERYWRER